MTTGSQAPSSALQGDRGRPRSPSFPAREIPSVIGAAIALALVMHWPLIPKFGRAVPGNLADPMLQAWEVAWGGHALLHQPLHLFDTNAFWPLGNSLAFSDALLGYAPAGLLGSGPGAALIRYNVLFLVAATLAFAGAYLLARQFGASWVGGAIAGAAFAYAPWRLSQVNHLNVLSSGGIPLSLFLLIRGHQRKRAGMMLAGWVVAAWQVTLGFVLGLQLMYLVATVALIAALWWGLHGRSALDHRVVVANAAGLLLFASCSALLSIPYFQAVRAYPGFHRSPSEVEFFSAPKRGLLAASETNLVWGRVTEPARRGLPWPEEQTLFPGLAAPALAAVGLVGGRWPRRRRLGLACGVVVTIVLALGYRLASGKLGYAFLHDHVPGWGGIRVPSRVMTLTTLGLALLAASGADRALEGLGHARPFRVLSQSSIAVVLLAAVLVEGAGMIPTSVPPPEPPALASLPAPQLHLPVEWTPLYMFWSTDGFPAIVNGYSGYIPPPLANIYGRLIKFPDSEGVMLLRDLGVRTVIYHDNLPAGQFWRSVVTRGVTGLALRRERLGALVVFRLSR